MVHFRAVDAVEHHVDSGVVYVRHAFDGALERRSSLDSIPSGHPSGGAWNRHCSESAQHVPINGHRTLKSAPEPWQLCWPHTCVTVTPWTPLRSEERRVGKEC